MILNKSSFFLVLAADCKGSEVVSIGRIPTAAARQGVNLSLSTGGRTHVHRNRPWGLQGGSPRASGEVKVAQSCPTLCDSMDYTVHGILQARILKWVAFPFSRGSSQCRDGTQVSHIAGNFFTS